MLDGIAKNTAITPDEDHEDIWPVIYKRAYKNMISDATKLLKNKFFVNTKLVTRETSQYTTTTNSNSGLAGLTIEFSLPKYAKFHIISIGVNSNSAYSSAGIFKIYEDDSSGELLETVSTSISAGKNTVNVDSDFEVDKLFISYNASTYSFKETENKYFANTTYAEYGPVVCSECFYADPDFSASVVQVNGGGLNVKFMIYCSMEKYVCENIKLFEDALLYKIGEEITVERRLGERLNKYTTLSQERFDELSAFYKTQYQTNLNNVIDTGNIQEDIFCFHCRNAVRTESMIP
jgi:hypothetical protein